MIPDDIPWPICTDCGCPLTFFFQLEFPSAHPWSEQHFALFYCVECASEDTAIPNIKTRSAEYLPHNASPQLVIENEDLISYQINFRTIVFSKDQPVVLRKEHPPKIKYHELLLSEMKNPADYGFKIGGKPNWKNREHLEEMVIYREQPMHFLLQIPDDFTFPKLPEAPFQRKIPFAGQPSFRNQPNYVLFNGLRLLVFGNGFGIAVLRG